MGKPVIDHECYPARHSQSGQISILRTTIPDAVEVAIIKGQKILVFIFKTLNRMRLTFWEASYVSEFKLRDLVLAVLIHGGDLNRSLMDEASFCLR